MRRHLAAKVDVRGLSHLEQLETRSDPEPEPGGAGARDRLSSASSRATPTRRSRETRAGSLSTRCRSWRTTTSRSSSAARERLRAKLSYTNLGFALAPATFTMAELRDLYTAALGHPVSATNLQRVLLGAGAPRGHGRAAALRTGRGAARDASTASDRRSSRSPTSSPSSGRLQSLARCSRSATACARRVAVRGSACAQVELATKIRGKYIRAIEEEQFDALPAAAVRQGLPAHVRGLPRARRPAVRRRVRLALRRRRLDEAPLRASQPARPARSRLRAARRAARARRRRRARRAS